jgi:hypothetical protein
MSKIIVILIALAMMKTVSANEDTHSVEQQCKRTIASMTAILVQLKSNPAMRAPQINAIIDGHTDDPKMRAFIKSDIVPRVLSQDEKSVQAYMHSNVASQRCEQAMNTYSVLQGN